MFNSKYFVLYKDNYNIYNLIKKIDRHYLLYFNTKDKSFYIVNSANNNQICLNFNNFSSNILKILQSTLIENSSKIFNFIEEHNNRLRENILKNNKLSLLDKLIETQKYSRRTNKFLKKDINKIIEGN